MDRVELARHEAERRLAELRAAVKTEFGGAPSKRYLWLALAAGAVGFTLAVRRSRRKRLAAAARREIEGGRAGR